MEYAVAMEARATSAVVVVEAANEDEAEHLAKEKGFERDDWFELTDFTVLSVDPE